MSDWIILWLQEGTRALILVLDFLTGALGSMAAAHVTTLSKDFLSEMMV